MPDDKLSESALEEIGQAWSTKSRTTHWADCYFTHYCCAIHALLRHIRAQDEEHDEELAAEHYAHMTTIENLKEQLEKADNLQSQLSAAEKEIERLTEAMRQGAVLYEPVIQQRVEAFRAKLIKAVREKDNEVDGDLLVKAKEVIKLIESVKEGE